MIMLSICLGMTKGWWEMKKSRRGAASFSRNPPDECINYDGVDKSTAILSEKRHFAVD